MNKLMMVAGAAMVAGVMAGCTTTGGASKDVVGEWQKERCSCELVQPTVTHPAAKAGVVALAPVASGLYKTTCDYVDKVAATDRGRRIYIGYVNDVKAKVEAGKSKADAEAEVRAAITPEQKKLVDEYLAAVKTSNFDVLLAAGQKLLADIADATLKVTNEGVKLADSLAKDKKLSENVFALAAETSKLTGDLDKIKDQLVDAGVGAKLYVQLVTDDQKAAKEYMADYPIEG